MASFVLFLLLASSPAQPAAGAAKTASAPAGESRTIVGEIVWVDLPTHLVLIRESVKMTRVQGQPPARQTVAMSVAPDVPVTRGKRPVTLSDLKAKDHVTARYVATPRARRRSCSASRKRGPARPRLRWRPATCRRRPEATERGLDSGMAAPSPLSPGRSAPSVTFARPGGGTVTTVGLLAQADGLPLLLVFFKVSCPTCRLSWPYVQRLHAAYGGNAVRVVGVSQNATEESRRFFAEFGNATFDLVLDPEPGFAASNAFLVESVPHFALISPAGVVEETFSGWSKAKMEALGARVAGGRSLARVPVVPPGDLVRDFQAG